MDILINGIKGSIQPTSKFESITDSNIYIKIESIATKLNPNTELIFVWPTHYTFPSHLNYINMIQRKHLNFAHNSRAHKNQNSS